MEEGAREEDASTNSGPGSARQRQNQRNQQSSQNQNQLSDEEKRRQEKRKVCGNERIEELATPNKRLLLALYKEHAYHFPKEKNDYLKNLLAQLYAMSPEETEKYFAQLRDEQKQAAMKKRVMKKMKRLLDKKKKLDQRRKAYALFAKIVKIGLMQAYTKTVPPLVSIRLRNLADVILEQICDMQEVSIPIRECPNGKREIFLIQVADWLAIATEHIYFAVQLKKNEELERIEKEALVKQSRKNKAQKDDTKYDNFKPQKASSPGTSKEQLRKTPVTTTDTEGEGE